MALVFLLLVLCQLGAAVNSTNYVKQVSKGKGFTGHPSWTWLQSLTLPLPKCTFNSTEKDAVIEIDKLWKRRTNFTSELTYWIDWLNYPPFRTLNWSDPSTFLCSTSYEVWATNYTDPRGPCPNGSFVSTPWWVVDDLTYTAPFELCDEEKDPRCSAYANSTLATVNATGDLVGELKKQKKLAEANNTISRYERIGKVLGVGYHVGQQCRSNINTALGDMDEYTQAGTQAATTIAALIPALLTVGNLFVPRSSEVFVTSFLVGIMSAMFTLGLPVSSISAIKDEHRFDVASWTFKARRSIAKFGALKDRAPDGTKDKPLNPVDLDELLKWSKEHKVGELTEEQASTDLTFSDLKKKVSQWDKRQNLTGIPAVLVACVQVVLFLFAIGPLYFSQGTPMLLFDCNGYWTSMWLFIAAGVSAVFRVFMWERGSHERVKLYAMSPTALESFKWFAGRNPHLSKTSSVAYVTDSMPPLYPPLIAKVETAVRGTIHKIMHGSEPMPTHRRISALQPSLITRQKNNSLRRWEVLLHNLRNPKHYFKQTSAKSQVPAAARRWRPVYLLMHLSTSGRNPIWTLLTGLVEGIILILLTVFFAAQWGKSLPFEPRPESGHRCSLQQTELLTKAGGNLLVMCYTTVALLMAITTGRLLGLAYVQVSVKTHGLHMIETQSKDQLRGCLRVLCTLTEVLVTINGAWFFEGHRLDNRPDWAHFQRCYSLGHMDRDDHKGLCDNCRPNANLGLPVANISKAPTATTLPMPRPLTSTSLSSRRLGGLGPRSTTSGGTSISSTSPRTSMQHGPPQQQASAPTARPTSIRRSTEPVRPPLSSNS